MHSELLLGLADAVGIPLRIRQGEVSGTAPKVISLGTLSLTVRPTVVSSYVGADGVSLVVKVARDLVLYFELEYAQREISLAVIDRSSMTLKPDRLFENSKPRTLEEARSLISKSAVRWFIRGLDEEAWEELKED